MPKKLQSWAGRYTALIVGDDTYWGIVQVEKADPSRSGRLFGRLISPENRYYLQVLKGRRIPMYSHGNRRVVVREGKLVQLTA